MCIVVARGLDSHTRRSDAHSSSVAAAEGLDALDQRDSREGRIWVVGRELLCGCCVDESLVKQPLDGPALSSSITQGVPRRNQVGVVFIDLVLESSERSSPVQ